MKRTLIKICFIVALCVMLAGCMGYREIDGGYLLTALGFENTNDGICVTAEMLITTDAQDTSPEPQLFSANGVTPEQALYNLSIDFSKPVYFDHCAVIVIGNGIEGELLKGIIDYCKRAENLNMAVIFVCSPDISTLLKTETPAAASGYHIMRILSQRLDEGGIDYQSKLYELERSLKNADGHLSFPILTGGDEISIEGEKIYEQYKETFTLNNTEGIAYSFIEKRFRKGRVCIGADYADIKSVKYKKSDFSDKEIVCHLKSDDITMGFCDALGTYVQSVKNRIGYSDINFTFKICR